MELADAPAEALHHLGRAPGEAASTLGKHGGLGEHVREAATGELGDLRDEHRGEHLLLGEHPAG
jgi:hypothetical protein